MRAVSQSGTSLHHSGWSMTLTQACSYPAAIQDFSCTCTMVWCCKIGFGGGGFEVGFCYFKTLFYYDYKLLSFEKLYLH